jgi:hypothetical protein
MIMTEETPKRPYPNLKWYPDSSGNMTIREAEAGINNCLAEIKRLRGVLREIAWQHYGNELNAIDNYNSLQKIARAALVQKTDD